MYDGNPALQPGPGRLPARAVTADIRLADLDVDDPDGEAWHRDALERFLEPEPLDPPPLPEWTAPEHVTREPRPLPPGSGHPGRPRRLRREAGVSGRRDPQRDLLPLLVRGPGGQQRGGRPGVPPLHGALIHPGDGDQMSRS